MSEDKTIKDVAEAIITINIYSWQKLKKIYFWFERNYMGVKNDRTERNNE